MELIVYYIILVVCLIGSAFFSSAETAFLSLTRVKSYELLKKGYRSAQRIIVLKENTQRLLITILIGNNVVNILGSGVATVVAVEQFGSRGLGLAVGVMTFLILTLGEIIPKSYAASNAGVFCLAYAYPITVIQLLLFPVVWVFEQMNHLIFMISGTRVQSSSFTQEDILTAIQLSEKDGSIRSSERELINNVFEFDDLTVGEIITPREQMYCLDGSTRIKDAVAAMIEKRYSRVPVYDKDPLHVVGVLYIKRAIQLLLDKHGKKTIREIMDQPLFVPETKRLYRMMHQFQRDKQHMALVVNEYGGIEGLITMEDILEELVGDIFDETDSLHKGIRRISAKHYMVAGDCEVEDFNKDVIDSITPNDEYNTVAGYIIKRLGRVPTAGEYVRDSKVIFKVHSATLTKIQMVRVHLR